MFKLQKTWCAWPFCLLCNKMLVKQEFLSIRNLSCTFLIFYLSKDILLFNDVFLLQAMKIKVQRLEKREQLHLLLQFRNRRCHREPTHFLFGIKNIVRRHLGLWKLKKNVMEVLVLSLSVTIFIFFKFVLFFSGTWKSNAIVELMN